MQPTYEQAEDVVLEKALECGGATGALVRSLDWSTTLVGPMAGWSRSLRNAVSSCLLSGIPTILGWGPRYVQFYNDAALAAVLHERHPQAMGAALREAWPEIADMIHWICELVRRNVRPVAFDDAKLLMHRKGQLMSSYFTFSFSPVLDERGEVAGIINAFVETTGRVLGERRLRSLRELAMRVAQARSAAEACAGAVEAFALNRSDIPFALVYLREPHAASATLAAALGIAPGEPAAPRAVMLDGGDAVGGAAWPLGRVASTGQPQLVTDLLQRFGSLADVGRPAPRTALVLSAARPPPGTPTVLPAPRTGVVGPDAFLVAGLNPHRLLDEEYRGFMQLVAAALGAGIANVSAYRDARERAERLAELDRAKSAFFSNISHEVRTPINLILGPIEDLLSQPEGATAPEQRERLLIVRRNALRLLRLVNDLLTMARIEANRVDAFFEPVDLASLTRELVSMFDSSAVRAGLRLTVDCPPLPEPIYVDRELWEKIVLNLLSNALKFTFEGEIAVALRLQADRAQLIVRDTGVGIPAEDLPHVFERFYRSRSARARSQEGAGIGLSLLRELARLHGGAISAESVEGQGTTFTVEIPRGSAHLPPNRVGTARAATPTAGEIAAPYVEESQRWTTAAPSSRVPAPAGVAGERPRILVAEDNPDTRDYLERLLAEHYEVETVADGAEALGAAQARMADLILSDVMMPGIDGLELVKRLRQDARTRRVPIVLLSARAGEEAAIEGLSCGADDYVMKPFSSRELLARVSTHLELARMRHEVADLTLKDEFMTVASHELITPLTTMRLNFDRARSRMEKAAPTEAVPLGRLERAMGRLEALVDDLLTAAAIQRGELSLSRARCDLVQLCREAAEDQAAIAHRLIRCELPDEAVEALVDSDATGHVVSSLLSNALKFSAQDRPVVLVLRRAGGEAIVAVRDEGPGIAAEELPRVFQRFHRASGIEVQAGSEVGFGLGLYICKVLLERQGGRIWAESTVGQGSTFSFALPLAAR